MIESLQKFDRKTAAGILARAALALAHTSNPAAAPVVPDELTVRKHVIQHFRKAVGADQGDDSSDTLARIEDLLDDESERLLGKVDVEAALSRLSQSGALPSDLYSVEIIPNIEDLHGKKFAAEKVLIELTVKLPDREQHVVPVENEPNKPFLISLFAKYFLDRKYPGRSFTMLVVGARMGSVLQVHQAWRLYQAEFNAGEASSLVDLLKQFAQVYGVDLEVGGITSKFHFSAEVPPADRIDNVIKIVGSKPRHTTTFSYFYKVDPTSGRRWMALLVGADLDKYRKMLRSYASSF